jgi:hypothetical protein
MTISGSGFVVQSAQAATKQEVDAAQSEYSQAKRDLADLEATLDQKRNDLKLANKIVDEGDNSGCNLCRPGCSAGCTEDFFATMPFARDSSGRETATMRSIRAGTVDSCTMIYEERGDSISNPECKRQVYKCASVKNARLVKTIQKEIDDLTGEIKEAKKGVSAKLSAFNEASGNCAECQLEAQKAQLQAMYPQPTTAQMVVAGIGQATPILQSLLGAYVGIRGMNQYAANYNNYVNTCSTTGVPCMPPGMGGMGGGLYAGGLYGGGLYGGGGIGGSVYGGVGIPGLGGISGGIYGGIGGLGGYGYPGIGGIGGIGYPGIGGIGGIGYPGIGYPGVGGGIAGGIYGGIGGLGGIGYPGIGGIGGIGYPGIGGIGYPGIGGIGGIGYPGMGGIGYPGIGYPGISGGIAGGIYGGIGGLAGYGVPGMGGIGGIGGYNPYAMGCGFGASCMSMYPNGGLTAGFNPLTSGWATPNAPFGTGFNSGLFPYANNQFGNSLNGYGYGNLQAGGLYGASYQYNMQRAQSAQSDLMLAQQQSWEAQQRLYQLMGANSYGLSGYGGYGNIGGNFNGGYNYGNSTGRPF